MDEEKSFIMASSPMTEEDRKILSSRAVVAFEMMGTVSEYLARAGIVLLFSVVSISVTSTKNGKLVVLGNPNMEASELKELLEIIGSQSDFGVSQAQSVVMLVEQKEAEKK